MTVRLEDIVVTVDPRASLQLDDARAHAVACAFRDNAFTLARCMYSGLATGLTLPELVVFARMEHRHRRTDGWRLDSCAAFERASLRRHLEAAKLMPVACAELATGPAAAGQLRVVLSFEGLGDTIGHVSRDGLLALLRRAAS